MKIAVIGSGISGLASAFLLSKKHEVHLFEKDSRLGGHTHTHLVHELGRELNIDSGFIVFNPKNYPLLSKLFAQIGVQSQATNMSFSVTDRMTGLEYSADTLNSLFSQRSNLFSASFWRMLSDIRRFYKMAPELLHRSDSGPSLDEYLRSHRFSREFIEQHLIPMASALWSSPSEQIKSFPARYLAQFMHNHQMLSLGTRPEWKVVRGGSSTDIDAMKRHWSAHVHLNAEVKSVRRSAESVRISTASAEADFDQVVFACHSDQALALIGDKNEAETQILSALPYQNNHAILHSDPGVLPGNRRAWAAWNAMIPAQANAACSVSYLMNVLQSIESETPYIVSLNQDEFIRDDLIIARMDYAHPIYTHQSVAAKTRRWEISGHNRTHFAGAYWGFGFHEDGMRSAVEVANSIGVTW